MPQQIRAGVVDHAEATKAAFRTLARRHQELTAEVEVLDVQIASLCATISPALLAAHGIGPEVAATNNALWRIALVRMSSDKATEEYVTRRTREGKSKKEIIRCLKRFIAREVFQLLTNAFRTPAESRSLRPILLTGVASRFLDATRGSKTGLPPHWANRSAKRRPRATALSRSRRASRPCAGP